MLDPSQSNVCRAELRLHHLRMIEMCLRNCRVLTNDSITWVFPPVLVHESTMQHDATLRRPHWRDKVACVGTIMQKR